MALYESINSNSMEYRDAVDRAICIPGCKVVPYFGAFLRELQFIFEENSPIIAVPESTDKVRRMAADGIYSHKIRQYVTFIEKGQNIFLNGGRGIILQMLSMNWLPANPHVFVYTFGTGALGA